MEETYFSMLLLTIKIKSLLPKTYTKQNEEITNVYKTYAEHVSKHTPQDMVLRYTYMFGIFW